MSDREAPMCSKHWCQTEYDLSSYSWYCPACEEEQRQTCKDLKSAKEGEEED